MADSIMNTLVTLIWLLAFTLLVVRRMETKGLRFQLVQLEDGLEFRYRLGVYAGLVRLVRDESVTAPLVLSNVFGWELRFPVGFTNNDMLTYAKACYPQRAKHQSHSKDLIVFNEVVNNNNHELYSIYGNIYAIAKPVESA